MYNLVFQFYLQEPQRGNFICYIEKVEFVMYLLLKYIIILTIYVCELFKKIM